MELAGKHVVLGVTGSVATYKAAALCSLLLKHGATVDVIMTKAACEFITPLTFETLTKRRCVSDMFARDFTYEVEHISLAKKADIFVVAPATANCIGKLAAGIADDMLTTTLMATRAPILLAPAMNTAMYENVAVQENMAVLEKRGVYFVEPQTGLLACGDVGKGKMTEPEHIVTYMCHVLSKKDLAGKNLLVTAGPTQEAIDPVRFISNHSTGKMGYAIAAAAARRGANVTLVSGPTSLATPFGVTLLSVKTAEEMCDTVLGCFTKQHIVIKAAAVADYRPAVVSEQKIKKKSDDMSIELTRNTDILKELGRRKREGQFLCGFSMETEDMLKNSKKKLLEKNCDLFAANNLKTEGAGFGVDTNVITFLYPNGENRALDMMSKDAVAHAILDEIISATGEASRQD